MNKHRIQFDELLEGQRIHGTLVDSCYEFHGVYRKYEKFNGMHLLTFDIAVDGRIEPMSFETKDIWRLYQDGAPPIAEAATDFDPEELGPEYPC